MSEQPEQSKKFLDLSMVQVMGGAAAAATAAFAGSYLGTVGTIIGAALASTVSAVAAAFYTASLRRTKELVRATERIRFRAGDRLPPVAAELDPAAEAVDAAATPTARRITWPRVAAAAAAVFVIALGSITALELATGRSLDGGSRTTLTPGFAPAASTGGGSDDSGTDTSQDSGTDSGQPGDEATQEPTDAPTGEPTEEPTQEPTQGTTPTPTPTPTPTAPAPTPSVPVPTQGSTTAP
ncbi:hypothetical protein GCM10027425_18470 [Alteromonas gracilis]